MRNTSLFLTLILLTGCDDSREVRHAREALANCQAAYQARSDSLAVVEQELAERDKAIAERSLLCSHSWTSAGLRLLGHQCPIASHRAGPVPLWQLGGITLALLTSMSTIIVGIGTLHLKRVRLMNDLTREWHELESTRRTLQAKQHDITVRENALDGSLREAMHKLERLRRTITIAEGRLIAVQQKRDGQTKLIRRRAAAMESAATATELKGLLKNF